MRLLYIDVDSLRPDHLGCYGYHRDTSPNIDRLAERGVRFTNVYVSDAPCVPSRTALWSGRCGFHTGVVGHGGTAAEPFVEGESRGFNDLFGKTGWMAALREAGFYTATVSSFADRHSAWHWYAAFHEMRNPGKHGHERADEVNALALDWLRRNGRREQWFLHVNYWDPHTPYRTPLAYGNPFAEEPLPEWLTEEVRARGWNSYGPHSPQELHGWGDENSARNNPRLPLQLDSMDAVRQWVDGYDVGIRYTDDHIGHLLDSLADLGVLDETMVIVSADHGEAQGEGNVWGDHHFADAITCRVPLIVQGLESGNTPRVDRALYYQYDWAATLVELVGGEVPENWDGVSFADTFRAGEEVGRPKLVTSQGAWSCQRGVRWDDYLLLHTYHDGYHPLSPVMLFNLANDPHEQNDLARERPDLVDHGLARLAEWYRDMARTSRTNVDPLMTVVREGGPFHERSELPKYVERLRQTGRAEHAARLQRDWRTA